MSLKNLQKSHTLNSISLPSVTTKISFRGRDFYLKRDELLHYELSGNKFRKLYQLINTPSKTYTKLISYGGTQSNAMLSMAYLANKKDWKFDYYCKNIPLHVKQNPQGNYKKALDLGMNVFEVEHDEFQQSISRLFLQINPHEVLVPQGGADKIAEVGIKVLADEISAWMDEKKIKNLNIITPAGTGTTAYYLAKSLPECKIITTPVVGDENYLKVEMSALGKYPDNLYIINTEKKYHFAKPYREFFQIYKELKEIDIEFDLIYAPKMWLSLLQNLEKFEGDVLYVHSGGISGNESMLKRYRFKGFI